MQQIRLGNTGLQVSRICLGMMSYGSNEYREWVLGIDAARPLVHSAVELGITFFDTADVYSRGVSEEVTGTLLAELFADRDDYVLATKVHGVMGDGPNDSGLSRKHIMASIDNSLRRLGTDHVDLYQIHRWDDETPIEETMEALHDIVKAGKARYIGASSMYAWQFAKAQYTADLGGWTRFVSMQDHYNLIYREEEREMHPFCLDQGIAVIPWSPLARGMLAGNRTRDARLTTRANTDSFTDRMYGDADHAVVDAVQSLAEQRGVPAAQVALAWMLGKPAVTAPIIGATKPGHVEDAVAALDLVLEDDEIAALEKPYVTHPVLGHGAVGPGR